MSSNVRHEQWGGTAGAGGIVSRSLAGPVIAGVVMFALVLGSLSGYFVLLYEAGALVCAFYIGGWMGREEAENTGEDPRRDAS